MRSGSICRSLICVVSLFAAALVAVLATATPARADSQRWGSFELAAGQYKPDIDSEPGLTAQPYQLNFGSRGGWIFTAGLSRAIFTSYGSLEAGFQSGWFRKTGHGLNAIDGTPSVDETKLQWIPTSLTLTYRFDLLADRYRIPLAPYGRAALERFNWWITEGSGSTVKKGATNGWSVAAGLALLLDVFDPGSARELDAETGINHTYLYFEAKKAEVDDFGSGSSWNLSDGLSWSGGLLLVF